MGHGGQDPGAIGRGGTRRKDVVLEIAPWPRGSTLKPGMRATVLIAVTGRLLPDAAPAHQRARRQRRHVRLDPCRLGRQPRCRQRLRVLCSRKGGRERRTGPRLAGARAADLKGRRLARRQRTACWPRSIDLSRRANITPRQAAGACFAPSIRVVPTCKPQVQQAGFVVLKSPTSLDAGQGPRSSRTPDDERCCVLDRRRARRAIFQGVPGVLRDHPPEGCRSSSAERPPRRRRHCGAVTLR